MEATLYIIQVGSSHIMYSRALGGPQRCLGCNYMAWLLWNIEQIGRGPGLSSCAICTVSLLLVSCICIAFHYKKCFYWSRKQFKKSKLPHVENTVILSKYYISSLIFLSLHFSYCFLPMKCTVLQPLSSNDETRGHVGKIDVHNGSTSIRKPWSAGPWVTMWSRAFCSPTWDRYNKWKVNVVGLNSWVHRVTHYFWIT